MKINKPIAITACAAVMLTVMLSTSSWVAWAIVKVALSAGSFFWYKFGIERAWRTKKVHHKHIYRYYGCADHSKNNLNLDRLLLGELRIKSIMYSDGYFEEIKAKDKQYKLGMFKIDVFTDKLVVGEKYYAEVLMRKNKIVTTLRCAHN